VPPFGPPGHPSFPSGHSFLGHLIALFLLEIPAIARRYGIFTTSDGSPGAKPGRNALGGTGPIPSPLFWLAQRVAKNRERIGVHYFSDSSVSRHLAAGIWRRLFYGDDPLPEPLPAALPEPNYRIECPTLDTILMRAIAEWEWPATRTDQWPAVGVAMAAPVGGGAGGGGTEVIEVPTA
jgi:hypothetical protein